MTNEKFRLRGSEMTRLETFIDAGFAFALTMLVISIDRIPTNHDEFILAFKGAPAFIACAALIGIFWRGHWHWSRRFGLEDGLSTLLSWALMITVLVYIYPLKIMFAGIIHYISGGYFPGNFLLETTDEARHLFAIYSVGFMLIALELLLLNLHALGRRAELALSPYEQFLTKAEIGGWGIIALTGMLSLILALGLSKDHLGWAGWIYFALPIIMLMYQLTIKQLAGGNR